MGTIVIILACWLVFLVVTSMWQRWRRNRELGKYGELTSRLGWQHVQKPSNGETERFLGDAPFPVGSRRGVTFTDYCYGPYRGRDAAAFEGYVVTTSMPHGDMGDGSSDDSSSSTYAVWAVQLPHSVGAFMVQRTGRLRRAFGAGDDARIGNPEFDERFTVRTLQPSVAAAALNGPLAEFLLGDPRAAKYPLRFTDTELISWDKDEQSPQEIEPALEFLSDVADLVAAQQPVGGGQLGQQVGAAGPAWGPPGVGGAQVAGDSTAAVGGEASAAEELIELVRQQIAYSGAPYRVEPAQSWFDIVPDLADPRWQGCDAVRVWHVTPDAGNRRIKVSYDGHPLGTDGSMGPRSQSGQAGWKAFERVTNAGAATLEPSPHNEDFGVAVVAQVGAKAGWSGPGKDSNWLGYVLIGVIAVSVLGAIAAGLAVLLGVAH
ncbi:hypothetical protein [Streptomyces endophyticus]|uniref:DUF3068 domain-containing protein n=1 Tax=Streptomyces endophyticus TaxID=714166 RepID=A0ABU6FJZ7_9ACTN|nr:hypothetical protein [Streptomyces endophyticus]MEB8344380.1 hypothetical protein [Streptomyces endophyticus]